MKNKLIYLSLIGCLFCFGCECTKIETSEVLTEKAVVDQLIFSPSHHSSNIDTGFSTSGNIVFTTTSIDIPSKYGVIFKCRHGKFYVDRKELWENFSQGDCVNIEYLEIYEVTYDSDGKEIKRSLKDYDFLDAKKVECLNDS